MSSEVFVIGYIKEKMILVITQKITTQSVKGRVKMYQRGGVKVYHSG